MSMSMNYQREKHTRSLSSSLPSRSHMNVDNNNHNENSNSCIIFNINTKNAPISNKKVPYDDGLDISSISKSMNVNINADINADINTRIISNRRRSESFAVYTGQEFFMSNRGETEENERNNNKEVETENENENENDFFLKIYSDDASFLSPDALNHHFYPHGAPNLDKKVVLYKTEMCRTFEETGICKYGTKCQFAHDTVEVRNIPRHPRYKTEICKTFWQMGNCPYGKRCCFIHTENELRENKRLLNSQNSNSNANAIDDENDDESNGSNDYDSSDIYGPLDMTIPEDSIIGEIHSHNSSRSISPSKLAEDLKRTISNVGLNSIFNNLSISNLPKLTIATTAGIGGKFSKIICGSGEDCSFSFNEANDSGVSSDNDLDALSINDPEFKNIHSSNFELWAGSDTPMQDKIKIDTDRDEVLVSNSKTTTAVSKFKIFDKSPGSRTCEALTGGIWSKATGTGAFSAISAAIRPENFYQETIESLPDKVCSGLATFNSGQSSTISSQSSSTLHQQQMLIDMLNLLDSTQ